MAETSSGTPLLHPALVRNTGYLISRLGFYASKQFAERLATVGLTPRMWGAMNMLDHEGDVTQQQLGRAIGMDPSSMVSTIDELEAKGWVERRRHPTDRRAYALHITDAGRESLTGARRLAGGAQNELLAPLDEAERAQLHDLLLRLVAGAVAEAGTGSETDPIGFRDPPPQPSTGDG
jgi:DNA-binding MarR family transcriptional regulator